MVSSISRSVCVISFVAFLAVGSVNANEGLAPAQTSESRKSPEMGIAQLALLADELFERSTALQREIQTFFDKSTVDSAWADIGKNLGELSGRMSKLQAAKRFNYDQTVQIKTAALGESKSIKRHLDYISQAALQLESWTTEWQKEKKRWSDLRSVLPPDLPQAVLKPVLAKGQQAVDGSLSLLTRQLGPLLEAQQRFAEQRARAGKLILELDVLLQRALKDHFRRSAPSMLSLDYYSQLSKPHPFEAVRQFKDLLEAAGEYLAKYGWSVLIQVVAFLLIALGIRRNKTVFKPHERWRFVSDRPAAAGLFTAVIFLGWLPGVPAPLVVRFASLALVCLSTARLVAALIDDPRVRRLIYFLAALLVATEALKVLEPPLPLFRLYIFTAALSGLLLGVRFVLRRPREKESPLFIWGFHAGTALFAVALFAEIGGYNALSSDLIECSLKSILSLSVCWMVVILVRGGLEWGLRTTALRSIAILRSKAEVIIRTSTRAIGFFAALFLLAVNLVIWGIYDSPFAALQGILSFSIAIGPWRLTLGLILTAGMILYVSLLLSRAVQAALIEGLFTVREVQKGARFSIARLIHYAFVLIGLVLALGALGLDLQNVTILAGALGVGIGFGLQGIVNNFVSGLILLFERPVKVGDVVEIDSQWAQIKRIGLRTTIVETFDQAELILPNSEIVNNRVKNWTLTHRLSRLTIPVGVAYGSDVPEVMRILTQCAEEHLKNSRPPAVYFTRFGESSLDFELRVYTDVDHRLQVQSELLQAIERRFREAGIEIPFPQRDLHIRSVAPSTTK